LMRCSGLSTSPSKIWSIVSVVGLCGHVTMLNGEGLGN